MTNPEEPAYKPIKILVDFLGQPAPRAADSILRDYFLGQYGYSSPILFKCITFLLYLLALTGVAGAVWLAVTTKTPGSNYSVALIRSGSTDIMWFFVVVMVIIFFCVPAKISVLKEERRVLSDALVNGIVTSGRVIDVGTMRHGRYGRAYVAVFAYSGPDGKAVVGKFTTLEHSVGLALIDYWKYHFQIWLLYNAEDPSFAVPVLSPIEELV